jgi:TonB family protein
MEKTIALAIVLSCAPLYADPPPPLSHEEIKSTVDKNLADVKGCMKENGSATGKLVVKFAISPDGKVVDPKPDHASSNAKLDKCIAAQFSKWTFPKPRGGILMGVVYPFIFSVPKPGNLTDQQIAGTINGHAADVKSCYDDALKQAADLKGTVNVTVVVAQKDGVVADAKIASSTTKSSTLDQCIVGKVKKWQFPKPVGETDFTVTFPLVLAPQNKPDAQE